MEDQATADKDFEDGILVGFNFDEFIFVVVAIVPWRLIDEAAKAAGEDVPNSQYLSLIIQEEQFTALNIYCASKLTILGMVENKGSQNENNSFMQNTQINSD